MKSKSLFKNKYGDCLTSKSVDVEKVDNTQEALLNRAARRKIFDSSNLSIKYKSKDRNKFKELCFDLSDLLQKYPHHGELLHELMCGAEYALPPEKSSKSARDMYNGIREFIEFLNSKTSLLNNQIVHVEDINITTCKTFSNWLICTYPRRSLNRKRYGSIRRCVQGLWVKYPGNEFIGDEFKWPQGPKKYGEKSSGYTVEQMRSLIEACKKDIAEVMAHHRHFQKISKEGTRILGKEVNLENVMFLIDQKYKEEKIETIGTTLARILDSNKRWCHFLEVEGLTRPDVIKIYNTNADELIAKGIVYKNYTSKDVIHNLPNFMVWLDGHIKKRKPHSISKIIHKLMGSGRKKSKIYYWAKENNYSVAALKKIYFSRGINLVSNGRNAFETKISQRPDKERFLKQYDMALATLKFEYPRFPLQMKFDEARSFFPKKIDDSFKGKLRGALSYKASKYGFWGSGINAFYEAIHFTQRTLYPFVLIVMINTGWNLCAVLDLTDDIDGHFKDDLIDPKNWVVVSSTKSKTKNTVYHRCNKNHAFGTYQILKYVHRIVSQHKNSSNYVDGRLWQAIRLDQAETNEIVTSFTDTGIDRSTSSNFISRHSFDQFGKNINHPAIRTGYSSIKELFGADDFEISGDLDHEKVDTVLSYTCNAESVEIKNRRISKIQRKFVDDLRNLNVRLSESRTLQELRDAINEAKSEAERSRAIQEAAKELSADEKTVVHIISPEAKKYIAVCENQQSPDWPGCEELLKKRSKCIYFNKCCLCSQSLIFPEALPYIARRILDLENLKTELSGADWVFLYGDESDGWNEILQRWNDKSAVKEAWELARSGVIVLPHVMRGV